MYPCLRVDELKDAQRAGLAAITVQSIDEAKNKASKKEKEDVEMVSERKSGAKPDKAAQKALQKSVDSVVNKLSKNKAKADGNEAENEGKPILDVCVIVPFFFISLMTYQ